MVWPLVAAWLTAPAWAQDLPVDALSCASVGGLQILLEDGTARVSNRGTPVFAYRYSSDLPKPFIHPLLTPAGGIVTAVSPPDHVHHRGLMFALGNVAFAGEEAEYVVFWGEAGAPNRLGHIIHVPGSESIEAVRGKPPFVTLRTRNEWRRLSDQALMLTEDRRVTVYDTGDSRGNLLTWESDLSAPERDVVLGPTEGRDVSYYGLGLRTAQDMDGGAIFDANGKEGEQAVLGDDAPWCAYIGPNEPQRGFAMFDHPTNPRYPTGWFVMSAGFGYMTASIVCHALYALPKGQRLRLRYGVCAFDGSPSPEDIEKWYGKWLKLEP
jgi:hypothetical protein